MECPDVPGPSYLGGDQEIPYDVEGEFWGFTEPLDNYKPGGLHPIILGDRLGDNGRFRVVHKLGHGGYGTVWLCQDTLSPTTKWRAVKVMSAKSSNPDCPELRAMEAFRGINRQTVQNDFHVSAPLEHFWIDGPNGRHLALVFVLGATTAQYMSWSYAHNRSLIKDLCFQLAKSLEFIHSRGICHGDFRPSNILVRLCDGVDSLPEETLLKSIYNGPEPDTGRVISLEDEKPVTRASAPSVPEQLVGSVSIDYNSGLCAASLAVTDFGVSYSVLDPPKDGCTGIPYEYASPEERFRLRDLLGPPSDIWSLGCCITSLAARLAAFADDQDDDGNSHASKLESLLGPMPDPFRAAYKEEHKKEPKFRFFNEEIAKADETNKGGDLKPITVPMPRDKLDEMLRKSAAELAEKQKDKRGKRIMSHGEIRLREKLQTPVYLDQTPEEADLMIKQYEVWRSRQERNGNATRGMLQLPFNEAIRNGKDVDANEDEERLKLRLGDKEVDQLSDLLMSIFKWHPKDRATIQQILNHPWFEGRNQHAAKVPPPVTPGNKSAVSEKGWTSYLHVDLTNRLTQGFP